MTDLLPERSAVRAALAALLTAQMTGSGQLVQRVYGYTTEDFGGAMPVLVVGSGGTERVLLDGVARSYPNFLIDLWVFVLYAEVDEEGKVKVDPVTLEPTFDEQDSEAALDAIEAGVRQLIDNGQPGASWDSIEYAGPTTVDIVPVGDQSYRRELIPLRIKTM